MCILFHNFYHVENEILHAIVQPEISNNRGHIFLLQKDILIIFSNVP